MISIHSIDVDLTPKIFLCLYWIESSGSTSLGDARFSK